MSPAKPPKGGYLAEFRKDPDFVAAEKQREKDMAERQRQFAIIERPVLDDLAEAGFFVNSVWFLKTLGVDLTAAFPVLLNHIERDYPDIVLDGMARSLAVPAAKPLWPTLVTLYSGPRFPEGIFPQVKQGLATALVATVTAARLEEFIELMRDPKNGESRVLLIRGLSKFRTDRARMALESFADDPVLGKETRYRLGQREKRRARQAGTQA